MSERLRCLNMGYSELVKDPLKTEVLDDYWNQNRLKEQPDGDAPSDSKNIPTSSRRASPTSSSSPNRHHPRGKSFSSAHGVPGASLSSYHPARSIPSLIDTFGPLIYPLYKAALLRKRILILGDAPVEQACNFGMLMSVQK